MYLKKLKTPLKNAFYIIYYVSHIFNIQETFKEKIFSFNQCHKIVRFDILLRDEKKDESNRMRDQRRPTPHFHSIHKFVITKMDVTSPKDKILLKNGKFCTHMYVLKFFKYMSCSQPQLVMLRICLLFVRIMTS